MDATPSLQIPRTIDFAEPAGPSDWRGGLLLVCFPALVLLPVLSGVVLTAREIWQRGFHQFADTSARREPESRPDHAVAAPAAETGPQGIATQ